MISPKLYGIYYIEEDHSMKKSRIEHVKKYSMLSLVEDLGFKTFLRGSTISSLSPGLTTHLLIESRLL